MAENDADSVAIPASQKELLIENDEILVDNHDKIAEVFESVLSNDKRPDKIDPIGDRLTWIFDAGGVPEEENQKLINAVLGTSINFDKEVRDELLEIDISSGTIDLFEKISINHGTELERQANRRTKGQNWWSSISTTVSSKNDAVLLSHEFTKDMEKEVTISNNINGSHLLALHVLKQTKSARNIIGIDALSSADRDVLEEIQETVEDIIEDIDEYEEDMNSSEGVSDSTEGRYGDS